MPTLPSSDFMPDAFIADIKAAALAIGAPFSESATRRMLAVYEKPFASGAVLWKTTDRPGDALSYRFYSRQRADTVAMAAQAGLIDPADPMGRLATAWSALNDGAPVQSCDFDADSGLAKTWIFLGGTMPLTAVLAADGVPAAVRKLEPALRERRLEHVRYTAVDYRHHTVNLYFRVKGPFSADHLSGIAELASSPAADPAIVEEMSAFLPRKDFLAATTIDIRSGDVERVAFYATQLPHDQFPALRDRLSRFFSSTPSYDDHDINIIAWSFGARGTYMKAERSWFGKVASLLRRADVLVSAGDQEDPALHA